MQHTGKCDCGCGQHSCWSVVKMSHGAKFWFASMAHLRQWEAIYGSEVSGGSMNWTAPRSMPLAFSQRLST